MVHEVNFLVHGCLTDNILKLSASMWLKWRVSYSGMSIYHYSEEFDAAAFPSFTSLPVRVRKDDSLSSRESAKFLAEWKRVPSKQQPKFGSRCVIGHLLSLVIPECPPELVPVVTKLFDYAFLENGKPSLFFNGLYNLIE